VFGGGATHAGYAVSDTAANLLNPDNLTGWGNATSVTATDASVTVATGYALYNLSATAHYTVSDTQDRIVQALTQTGGAPTTINLNAVLGEATSVSITGGATLSLVLYGGKYIVSGSAAALSGLPSAVLSAAGYMLVDSIANGSGNIQLSTGAAAYRIVDTSANIVAAAPSYVSGANKVTVTDTINYATLNVGANSIATINGGLGDVVYNLSDTAANLYTGNALKAGVAGATNVTITTAVNAIQASNLVAGHATGNTYSISDTAGTAFAGAGFAGGISNAGVHNAVAVTITGALTDAQAVTLVAQSAGASYSVNDTVGNLFTGAALKAEVTSAQSVSLTGTATVAQAATLTGLGAKFTGGYTVTDTAANLSGASSALLQGATTVTETTTATVAQEVAIQAALGAHTIPAYSITDTASAISGATQALLTGATGVTATGVATAAQGATLSGLTQTAGHTAITYSVSDTTANLLLAGNAAAFGANTQAITDTDASITTAQAHSVHALTAATGYTYAISDTSANIELAPNLDLGVGGGPAVNLTLTVTDTINTATASLINGVVTGAGNHLVTETFAKVSDTIAHLNANAALTAKATAVAESAGDGTDSVANVETFLGSAAASKLVGGYNVQDTAAHILQAWYDQDHHGQIVAANSVALSAGQTASVAEAAILEPMANVASHSVAVSDTLANINGNLGVANLAGSITAAVNEANGGTLQSFNDLALTPSATLNFTHGAGTAETVAGPAAGVFTLTGADLLTLKLGDTINLTGYGATTSDGNVTGAPAQAADGHLAIMQGNISNGGATFTVSSGGTSTLVLWDAQTGAGLTEAGVVLIGVTPSQINLLGNADATHIGIHST
jgi:hypothetical protein